MARKKQTKPKSIEALQHRDAKRTNIPTAEYQSMLREEDKSPIRVAYERRNRDLDPQLVWRGKDMQDWSDLVVPAPPLYIQEKIHPKVLIDDLVRSGQWLVASGEKAAPENTQIDLFSDFNGLPDEAARTEFYQHEANWSNRMILGDSLQVMASLAEREGLRGKVQCIYIDPPYGIKFNSNFQWSTTSRDVKDGKAEHITREPEQVKAFRDTWRDGIHSYLTYLRDRLTVARDLLTESGSIFVQIGDENVHRVRALMDEVFGEENFVSLITFQKSGGFTAAEIPSIGDFLLWYCINKATIKYRNLFLFRSSGSEHASSYNYVDIDFSSRPLSKEERAKPQLIPDNGKLFQSVSLTSSHEYSKGKIPFSFQGKDYGPAGRWWSTSPEGLFRLSVSSRIFVGGRNIRYKMLLDDFPVTPLTNIWTDLMGAVDIRYVVQTNAKVIQRCLLMTTDPGDLVLDPTCGSGTTAYVAEQWGRRWITIDTSRVALALARARLMGARYPYYLLADSKEGQLKEAEISGKVVSGQWLVDSGEKIGEQEKTNHSPLSTHHSIRQGFVYERVPHITLKSIANNAEIDVIWEKFQEKIGPLLAQLGRVVSDEWPVAREKKEQTTSHKSQTTQLEEWHVPREFPDNWPEEAKPLHEQFWQQRIARQKEIDASIAAKADYEFLYDKPYPDNKKVRVAGPFTVESLSPHRVLAVDENDELIDMVSDEHAGYGIRDFAQIILENLKTAGVQQAHKEDRIVFTSITPWPGHYVCAEGVVDSGELIVESGEKKKTRHSSLTTNHSRIGIFIGPEFGTVSRPDLVAAAREAGDAGFDALLACAFNYDAHSSEFEKLGRIPVLKARMNADLHMADELKNTGKGNLFVIFGEPDVEVVSEEWLVGSSGRRVAPYEVFKLISGLESLAEINGLDRADLRSYAALSSRGEIWHRIANAAGSGLDRSQHRGRAGAQDNRGISALSRHCAGFAGGIGDVSDFVRTLGFSDPAAFRSFVERLRGSEQNAQWSAQITLHSPLITNHFTQVTVKGVDVFHPQTGEVRSDGPEGIACWFIDTDYNEESFFVRHAYFLGAGDPYKSLKTTLKAEINEEAWGTLHSNVSRPFEKPQSGRIAVKIINHLGDEVMKVFRV